MAHYKAGDIVALGNDFPAFQRGWPAKIVHAYDFVSDFDRSPMYHVRFIHVPNRNCGDGGWLNVSELNLTPLTTEAK